MIQVIGLIIGIAIGSFVIYTMITREKTDTDDMFIVQFPNGMYGLVKNGEYLDIEHVRTKGRFIFWSWISSDCQTSRIIDVECIANKYKCSLGEPKIIRKIQ